jgi:apolipoprotein N-acyltransferase
MLRATNTGMTAIVGADGVIQASLPPFTTGVLTGEIRAHGGLTPYGRWGDWPAVGLILVLLVSACGAGADQSAFRRSAKTRRSFMAFGATTAMQ